jgi:hypothetical protein
MVPRKTLQGFTLVEIQVLNSLEVYGVECRQVITLVHGGCRNKYITKFDQLVLFLQLPVYSRGNFRGIFIKDKNGNPFTDFFDVFILCLIGRSSHQFKIRDAGHEAGTVRLDRPQHGFLLVLLAQKINDDGCID